MMAQAFPPGMASGHPGMGGHHPMAGMQHAGGPHMGGPGGPAMMQGMHPGVSAPQSQGPMVTGIPTGPGTPAPGGMQNPMAMAHLGPQQHMFQQQGGNPQMFQNMPMNVQQQQMMRHQMMQRYAQQQQQGGMPMQLPNGMPQMSAQQMAQMKMGMMPQHQMQMQGHQNAQQALAQQQQHQQQLMRAQAQQQAVLAVQNQQRQVSQQMQMSRSQEQPTTQPPQPHPTPAPQAPPQPQSQPTPQSQPPTSAPTKAPAPLPAAANQPPNQGTPQIKQGDGEDEPQIKQQDNGGPAIPQDVPKEQIMHNQRQQALLQLISLQNILASPGQPQDLDSWETVVDKFFSPVGFFRHQFRLPDTGQDKVFTLQYTTIARYLHNHYINGIKQLLLSSYGHTFQQVSPVEPYLTSSAASWTYVYHNDVRITMQGTLRVLFDEQCRMTRLEIACENWMEYLPRHSLIPASPDQTKDGKNKNAKKNQAPSNPNMTVHMVPNRTVGPYGVTNKLWGWLEVSRHEHFRVIKLTGHQVAEVMNQMAPLFEYSQTHGGIAPKEAMNRMNIENAQVFANANQARLQNQMARQANGQIPFPQAMNGPNQFASPNMQHLGIPQGQGSPALGGAVHTPSPAQNAMGGVAMMHQMSAQGSNLSGSQGPSTNTSPNVNKRRRASQIKLEEENAAQNADTGGKVKPSPRMPKRQKGS